MKKILIAVVAVALIVIPAVRTIYRYATLPNIGEEIPAYNLAYINNASAPTGKLTLLEFWATWCSPCIDGIPKINKLHADYGPRGLVIIAISDEEREVVERFVKRRKINYATAIDTDGALHHALGVDSIPFAILIDENRKILWRGSPTSLDKKLLESRLAPALTVPKDAI
jgi:cytochrome c biogenesis protein CcmG, thiol:disulfide interchange protein DsbE